MTRTSLTTLALLALSLSLPRSAAAEDAMCGLRGSVVVVVASEFDALVTPALPLFGAFSAAPAAVLAIAGEAGEVLWCASADDPRCAPAHSDSGSTTQLRGGTPLFVIPTSPPPIADSPESTLGDPCERDRARVGVARSLDRPPR